MSSERYFASIEHFSKWLKSLVSKWLKFLLILFIGHITGAYKSNDVWIFSIVVAEIEKIYMVLYRMIHEGSF